MHGELNSGDHTMRITSVLILPALLLFGLVGWGTSAAAYDAPQAPRTAAAPAAAERDMAPQAASGGGARGGASSSVGGSRSGGSSVSGGSRSGGVSSSLGGSEVGGMEEDDDYDDEFGDDYDDDHYYDDETSDSAGGYDERPARSGGDSGHTALIVLSVIAALCVFGAVCAAIIRSSHD